MNVTTISYMQFESAFLAYFLHHYIFYADQ